jgi:predicted ATPase
MKLESFYIGHHRVLHELSLDFQRTPDPLAASQKYTLDFLVGVNGTGKSTVLQLLGMLFTQLHQQSATAYDFPVPIDLTYSIRRGTSESRIRLCNIPARLEAIESEDNADKSSDIQSTLHYQKDGDVTWLDGGQKPLLVDDLPYVVIYSTGRLADWRQALQNRAPIQQGELADNRTLPATTFEWPGHLSSLDKAVQPESGRSHLIFIEPERLALITLCGLIGDRWTTTERRLNYVLKEAQVEALLGFSLRLRYHEGLHDLEVKALREELKGIASRTIQQGSDCLLIFDLPQDEKGEADALHPISLEEKLFGKLFNTPLQMFEALYKLYDQAAEADCPLRQVNLFIKRPFDNQVDNEQPMLHLFRWLSDGEQSLLARMALLSLFRDHNLLILLDEPEVHFNDVWKREIVNVLDKIMSGYNSHTLIATHSSIALTDVPREDIVVLRRNGRYTSEADSPLIQTFGADPSDILVHVFGTPSASGERSVTYIQQEISSRRTKEDLESLEKIVAPGYWRYRIQLEKQRLRVLGAS